MSTHDVEFCDEKMLLRVLPRKGQPIPRFVYSELPSLTLWSLTDNRSSMGSTKLKGSGLDDKGSRNLHPHQPQIN
jgi:hypothetical protein